MVATAKESHSKSTQKSEVIHTNEKHPFLTKEKGFVPVSQLKRGMHVLEANGDYGVVAKLVTVPGAMWMYNLTVAQDHTYAVGVNQWIVHNDNACTDTVKFGQSQVQKKLFSKHPDVLKKLGVDDTKFNTANFRKAVAGLKSFMQAPGTAIIRGTYRAATTLSAIHYFDLESTLNVIVDADTNEFVSAWFLDVRQAANLLTRGHVQ